MFLDDFYQIEFCSQAPFCWGSDLDQVYAKCAYATKIYGCCLFSTGLLEHAIG